MKKLFYTLFLFISLVVNAKTYNINGFNIVNNNKWIKVNTLVKDNESRRCITINKINTNKGIKFTLSKSTVNTLKLNWFVEPGKYVVLTTIKYKNGSESIKKTYIYIK